MRRTIAEYQIKRVFIDNESIVRANSLLFKFPFYIISKL